MHTKMREEKWSVGFHEGDDCITVRGVHIEYGTHTERDRHVHNVDMDIWKHDGSIRCAAPSPVHVILPKECVLGFYEKDGLLFFKWKMPTSDTVREATIGVSNPDSDYWLEKLNALYQR